MLPTHTFSCQIPNGFAHCTIALDTYHPIDPRHVQAELTQRIKQLARNFWVHYRYTKIEIGFLYQLTTRPGYYSLQPMDKKLLTCAVIVSENTNRMASWSGFSMPEINFMILWVKEPSSPMLQALDHQQNTHFCPNGRNRGFITRHPSRA